MKFELKPLQEILSCRGLESRGTVQKHIDSEVLRYCSPYVPIKTGTLRRSGTDSTDIGSGEVVYNTPYARQQYYNTSESRPYSPLAGAKWFERMKIDHKDDILRSAAKIAGGKVK